MRDVRDGSDDVASVFEKLAAADEEIARIDQVFQDISQKDDVESLVRKGAAEVELLDVADDDPFGPRSRPLRGLRIDLDARDPAASVPKHSRDVTSRRAYLQDLLVLPGEQHELRAGGLRVGEIDLRVVPGGTSRLGSS